MENNKEGLGGSQNKPIQIKSEVCAQAASNLKQVRYKAVAGTTPEELIERNTIGEIKTEEEEQETII